VRAYPASRRHPHFSRDSLSATLGASGYAAHMETPLFTDAATALIAASRTQALCLMCAETNPADCHRSHISDWHAARLF